MDQHIHKALLDGSAGPAMGTGTRQRGSLSLTAQSTAPASLHGPATLPQATRVSGRRNIYCTAEACCSWLL